MLGVEAMAKRMRHDVVGHYPLMPSVSKTAQALVATRCFEHIFAWNHDDNPFVPMQDSDGPRHRPTSTLLDVTDHLLSD
jgi:hypothetical protein